MAGEAAAAAAATPPEAPTPDAAGVAAASSDWLREIASKRAATAAAVWLSFSSATSTMLTRVAGAAALELALPASTVLLLLDMR